MHKSLPIVSIPKRALVLRFRGIPQCRYATVANRRSEAWNRVTKRLPRLSPPDQASSL